MLCYSGWQNNSRMAGDGPGCFFLFFPPSSHVRKIAQQIVAATKEPTILSSRESKKGNVRFQGTKKKRENGEEVGRKQGRMGRKEETEV